MKKHQNFILAVATRYVIKQLQLRNGFTPCESFEQGVLEGLVRNLVIKQREQLEKDTNFLQLVPYVVVRRSGKPGSPDETFMYRRTKKVGEERLVGATSFGFGGHTEIYDIESPANGEIDLLQTLLNCVRREMAEEVQGLDVLADDAFHFKGFLLDRTNDVGAVHLGVVYETRIPAEAELKIIEEELQAEGFFTDYQLFEACGNDPVAALESWSKILLSHWFSCLSMTAAVEEGGAISSILPGSLKMSSVLCFTLPDNTPPWETSCSDGVVRIPQMGLNQAQAEQVYDLIEHLTTRVSESVVSFIEDENNRRLTSRLSNMIVKEIRDVRTAIIDHVTQEQARTYPK